MVVQNLFEFEVSLDKWAKHNQNCVCVEIKLARPLV